MKLRFVYLTIFLGLIYSILTFLSAETITINDIATVIMVSGSVIFVGYVLDSKADHNKNKNT
ncbi:hypothetical protein [Clostridium cylindrosporum]|uniref:Uncharacterized protein n=1 Tax=Clostridium cylindrosporum DSM 605 TaxID=1121307 RepID=A0A0J8DBQ9_CLOCY|nr:hypothetical protein [Clostridium cylindrosporum]KMT23292.1 hypothetical protein CLCY_8c00280 [Clostridium cylindrosporum DSM 605]